MAFFLPNLSGCRPYRVVMEGAPPLDFKKDWHDLGDNPAELERNLSMYLGFLFPYLHGLLTALSAIICWRQCRNALRRGLLGAAGLAAICAAVTPCGVFLSPRGTLVEGVIPVLLTGWMAVGLCILSALHAPQSQSRVLWISLAGALPATGWFVILYVMEDKAVTDMSSGWYTGASGAFLLAIGAVLGLWSIREKRHRPLVSGAPKTK